MAKHAAIYLLRTRDQMELEAEPVGRWPIDPLDCHARGGGKGDERAARPGHAVLPDQRLSPVGLPVGAALRSRKARIAPADIGDGRGR